MMSVKIDPFATTGYSTRDDSLENFRERIRSRAILDSFAYRCDRSKFHIQEDGTVDTYDPVIVENCLVDTSIQNERRLLIKFRVSMNLDLSNLGLTSMYGLPLLGHIVNLSGNNISSFNEMTECQYESLHLTNNPLTSLSGLDKKLKKCRNLFIPSTIQHNLLGCVRIHGLTFIDCPTNATKSLREALRIVNKYLKAGRKDVISCQEELIDNALGNYARF